MPVSSRLARKVPSISPTVGKFWMPEKPSAISALQELVGDHERVGAVDAGQHRRVLHHRQHLVRHLADDLVGVAVGQQARQRAAAGHAVAARVVDHDQVDAAGLLALGRQAGAGAAADDRLARARSCARKRVEDGLAGDAGHGRLASRRQRAARSRRRCATTSRQAATSASAKASSLMCSGRRCSWRFGAAAEVALDRFEQHAVGLGIVEAAGPGRSIATRRLRESGSAPARSSR